MTEEAFQAECTSLRAWALANVMAPDPVILASIGDAVNNHPGNVAKQQAWVIGVTLYY